MDFASSLVALGIIGGICALVFLVLRVVMLWYWKVDVIVANQEKQIAVLHAILRNLNGELSPEDKARKFDAALEAAKQREHSKI